MIIGIDGGSSTTKNSQGVIIDSKVTKVEPMNKCDVLEMNGIKYYLGEGEYDTSYRKIEKANYIPLLFGSLALTTDDVYNKVVVGLPLSQYQEDRAAMQNLILNNRDKWVEINKLRKHIVIEDVEVVPEGRLTVDDEFEGIVVDIGGRTTDIFALELRNLTPKVINPQSIPLGIQNLYSDFIKIINKKHGLDLKDHDAERILRRGLKILGKTVDITMEKGIFYEFADNLISKLQVEYSLKTHDVKLVGGGSILLFDYISKKVPCELVEDSVFANAIAYENYGRDIWYD